MLYLDIINSLLDVILITIPVLFIVALVTVAERRTLASMQRRLGPNNVGYYGLLQAFADALKLLLKEYVSPTQANLILFFLGPIITLVFSLLGYAAIPYVPGLAISDFDLGILYMLAVSSLSTYGILLAGWSANSKYAFLGSLRSTAQLISYELILSSALLLVVLLTSSLNLTINIEAQKAIWFIVPLFPIFYIFFIGAVAETNRAPFDLAEAESELVSGFMTEHSAVVFVFFFLAEYASIVLICILTSLLYLGGYNLDFSVLYSLFQYIEPVLTQYIYPVLTELIQILDWGFRIILTIIFNIGSYDLGLKDWVSLFKHIDFEYVINNINEFDFDINNDIESFVSDFLLEGNPSSLIIGLKTFILIFVYIWVRASFPRVRFDQLMSYCWTVLLPLIFAFIILIPCILYIFEIIPCNLLY